MLLQPTLVFAFLGAAHAASELRCPNGYEMVGVWCYRFDPAIIANYYDALSNCISTNDNLVSIHDNETNTYVRRLDIDGVLIGLRYDESAQNYSWSDGSPVDYNQIDPNFIAWIDYFGSCAANVDGIWKNVLCEDKRKFACQSKAVDPYANRRCPNETTIHITPVTIYSPGYPEKYELHNEPKYCIYKIAAAVNHYIKINFDVLNLDGNEGYLAVYKQFNDDFADFQADNDFNGLNVVIEHNLVLLKLVGSLTGKYKFTATAVNATREPSPTPANVCPDKKRVYPVPCSILSPGYPSNFNLPVAAQQCSYLVATKIGTSIRMHFAALAETKAGGDMIGFVKFADAVAFSDNHFSSYEKANSSSITYDVPSAHFGLVMSNRNSGNFKIDFTGCREGCRSGWIPFGSSCYQMIRSHKTFTDARAYCEAESSHLAMLKTRDAVEFANSSLGPYDSPNLRSWIGLAKSIDGWKWIDGEPLNEELWCPGEPDGCCEPGVVECGEIFDNADNVAPGPGVDDGGCDRLVTFICEYEV